MWSRGISGCQTVQKENEGSDWLQMDLAESGYAKEIYREQLIYGQLKG